MASNAVARRMNQRGLAIHREMAARHARSATSIGNPAPARANASVGAGGVSGPREAEIPLRLVMRACPETRGGGRILSDPHERGATLRPRLRLHRAVPAAYITRKLLAVTASPGVSMAN